MFVVTVIMKGKLYRGVDIPSLTNHTSVLYKWMKTLFSVWMNRLGDIQRYTLWRRARCELIVCARMCSHLSGWKRAHQMQRRWIFSNDSIQRTLCFLKNLFIRGNKDINGTSNVVSSAIKWFRKNKNKYHTMYNVRWTVPKKTKKNFT